MTGYAGEWLDLPDYIIAITKEIWEDRGISTLERYYAPDIVVRTPMGISVGNQATIRSTMATVAEFPDRELFAEDVIWCGSGDRHLSSHRITTTGTHTHDGAFGPATGRRFRINVLADCAVRGDVIDDEWLVRDYGGLVRQLGQEPRAYARTLLERGDAKPFLPEDDRPGPYTGTGNDDPWGARYGEVLTGIMEQDFRSVSTAYDRAVMGRYAGGVETLGREGTGGFWLRLRSAFPDATFRIHHQVGLQDDVMGARAALRWSLDGEHSGWGMFGAPTGKRVHVMGISHAAFGPWGIRREWTLIDEVAIWQQIEMQQG